MTAVAPRAPAVGEKLEAARIALAALNDEVAQAVLDAAENASGAPKRLFDMRTRITAAEREVAELEKAYALAAKLDRQAAVTAAATMRAEQLAEFTKQLVVREKAMDAVLKAASAMAAAYGEFSEATVLAAGVVPAGTFVPTMGIGDEGLYGSVFGPCERLILAELYRLAPERQDGIGRFVLPFAKPPSQTVRDTPHEIPAGIDALRMADKAIVADIAQQIERLNGAAIAAVEARKDAA